MNRFGGLCEQRKKEMRRSADNLTILDDFLKEEGKLAEFQAAAIEEVLAWQIATAQPANDHLATD
jgi:hypothetical protein